MARINRESITTLIVDARPASAGANEFDRAAAKIKSAASASQRIIERTNIMLGEQGKAYQRLVRQIDPAAAANEKFAKGVKLLDMTFKGNTGLSEYARLLKLLETKYKDTGAAAGEAAAKQADAFTRMRAKYDPLFAANEKYKAELRGLMEAHTADAIDEPTFRSAHARIEQDFNPANLSARRLSEAQVKLAADQKRAADAAADHARKIDLLRARYDPAFAALLRYRDALEEAGAAERIGALQGEALHREMDRIVSTLHPAAVAAKELADADAKLAMAQAEAARKSADQARALDLLRAKYDPAFAATLRYKDALKGLNDAATAGAIKGKPLAEALASIQHELDPVAIASRKAADAQAQLQQRAQALTERVNPAARAQRVYNEAIREAQELHWRGAITMRQYDDAVAHATTTLHGATQGGIPSNHSEADAARRTARRITQLSPQISDIVTQAFSGTNPLTILVQQGPQIADIFGGIPTLLRAIPPHVYAIAAAFAAVAIPTAIVSTRFREITAQTRQLEAIARTVNPQIAGMAGSFRDLTLEIERVGSSRKDAMATVSELARVRQLGAGMIGSLGTLAPDVVTQLGGSIPEAAKKLAEAFSGGSAAIRELDATLNFLEPDELKEIERMERAGDRAGMLRVALNALTREYQGEGRRAMSDWTQALENIGNAWDTLIDKITRYPIVIAALTAIGSALTAATELLPGATPSAGGATVPQAEAVARIKTLQDQANEHVRQINEATSEAMRLSSEGNKAEADAAWARAGDLNGKLQEIKSQIATLEKSSSLTPPANRNGLTTDEQKRVNTARGVLDAETKSLQTNRVQRQVNMAGEQAYQAALSANRTHAEASMFADQARERAIRDLNIAIMDENEALDLNAVQTLKVADAYRVSTGEAIRADAVRQASIDHMNTGVDIVERANRLLRQGSAQAYEAVGKVFDTTKLDVANQGGIADASRGSVADQQAAQRRAESEATYRDALSRASAIENNQGQVEAILAERDAYEKTLEVRDQYARQTQTLAGLRRGMEDGLATIDKEYELVGKSNVERDRELGLLRIRQALVAAGYSGQPLEDEIARLEKINGLIAERSEQTRRATEAFERNKQAWIDTADIMRDGFEDLVMNGESFADVLKNISKALLQLGLDVVVMDPLKDAFSDMMKGGSGMTPGSYTPAAGSGIWGTLMSLAQTGVNMYAGMGAGTGPSLMPNAANDAGALSAGALLENYRMFPVAHSGWHVGREAPPAVRLVPSSVMVNAPRLHGGGMRPGEFGAILERGEEVLTARDPRHRRNFQRGGGHTVVMNITTPDANSFRQSQGQITAAAARSLQIAARRNG